MILGYVTKREKLLLILVAGIVFFSGGFFEKHDAYAMEHMGKEGIVSVETCNEKHKNDSYEATFRSVITCLRPLAMSGETVIQYNLAVIYSALAGITSSQEDIDNAEYWWTVAAGKGFPGAFYGLIDFHMNRENYSRALEISRKGNEAGNDEARTYLGLFYWKGTVLARDRAKGFELIQSAAYQGNSVAQYLLYCIHSSGFERDSYVNYLEAYIWHVLASKSQGSRIDNAETTYAAGRIREGRKCDPDRAWLNSVLTDEELLAAQQAIERRGAGKN